jgi:hypothetical protein
MSVAFSSGYPEVNTGSPSRNALRLSTAGSRFSVCAKNGLPPTIPIGCIVLSVIASGLCSGSRSAISCRSSQARTLALVFMNEDIMVIVAVCCDTCGNSILISIACAGFCSGTPFGGGWIGWRGFSGEVSQGTFGPWLITCFAVTTMPSGLTKKPVPLSGTAPPQKDEIRTTDGLTLSIMVDNFGVFRCGAPGCPATIATEHAVKITAPASFFVGLILRLPGRLMQIRPGGGPAGPGGQHSAQRAGWKLLCHRGAREPRGGPAGSYWFAW